MQHKGKDLFSVWNNLLDSDVCEITDLSLLNLSKDELPSSLGENIKIVLCRITQDQEINSVEGAYLKLHLLSYKFFQPNTLNLDNLFNILPNVAWTNKGPIDLSEIEQKILESKSQNISIEIKSIDKFPRLVDYIVPAGVRIADTSRVRLGAYLSEGTTIMHEGFVNFNAGTLGAAMIEGRISAGVVIGENSDLGGGASTMGTLSGGNEIKISVGENCLMGANSGLGIPLGNNCIIEAGLYITGGSKVEVFDQDMQSQGIIKAEELSNKNNILFIRNSLSGAIEARVNAKSIELNDSLHLNQ
jgi:2,3,4,5-tetrahydropyridine-2-carboxylate N-succinyltransferase